MATHLFPHTPAHSPARPVSAYSAHSTIRRVTPSPDSLTDALSQGYAAHSTPRHPVKTQSMNNLIHRNVAESKSRQSGAQSGYDNHEDLVSRAHSVTSPASHKIIARKITPSRIPGPSNLIPGRTDEATGLRRRKAGRISPSKLGAPRQHRPILPATLLYPPAALEKQVVVAAPGSQAAPAGLAMPAEPPRTPPAPPGEERARLAEFTLFPTEDPFVSDAPIQPPVDNTIRPGLPPGQPSEDYFRTQTDKHEDPDAFIPFPKSPRKPIPSSWKRAEEHGHHSSSSSKDIEPDEITPITPLAVRKPHLPRNASTASWRSNATFSTPGRDEMERKRAQVDAGDEGPFGAAKGMQDLAEKRRQVSEGKSVSQRFEDVDESNKKKKKEKGGGLCRCVVM